MYLSVDFQGVHQLQEIVRQERISAERLENALEQLYRQYYAQDEYRSILQNQLHFIQKEKQQLDARANLLEQILDTFSEAKNNFDRQAAHALDLLNQLD